MNRSVYRRQYPVRPQRRRTIKYNCCTTTIIQSSTWKPARPFFFFFGGLSRCTYNGMYGLKAVWIKTVRTRIIFIIRLLVTVAADIPPPNASTAIHNFFFLFTGRRFYFFPDYPCRFIVIFTIRFIFRFFPSTVLVILYAR